MTVREWVEKRLPVLGFKGFLPSAVVKETGLPGEHVYEELFIMVKERKLELLFAYRCEECGSDLYTGDREMVPSELYCDRCDEEWESKYVPAMPMFMFLR